ncbi:MAG TPA: hypothetical protein VFU13_20015 [Steroidobacteraceae bacterium]|nr:hypothetical protein [Steroidobacteraceae bacterium]
MSKKHVFTSLLVASALGLSSPVFAQADQILRPIGGPGGGQFFGRCPIGDLLTGFELRTGDDVDAIRPICARAVNSSAIGQRVKHAQSFGGTGGTVGEIVCPDEAPLVTGLFVGYEGEKTIIVNTLHLYCGRIATDQPLSTHPTAVFDGSEIRRTKAGPFSGHSYVPLYSDTHTCPSGLVAVGISGRSGIWLDSVGLICGGLRVEQPDGGVSPSKPRTPCEKAREARERNSPFAAQLEKHCLESTAVVTHVDRAGGAISTAGPTPPAAIKLAELDALAGRGQGLAGQDPLSMELRNRAAEGAARRGFDIGMAAAEGQTQHGPGKQRIHDALSPAEQEGFDVALAFSLQRNKSARFAQVGAFIANADPAVAEARAREPDVFYWLGFDIASGIFGDPAVGAQGNTATGPGSLGIRDALSPAAQRGFNASAALHLGRDYK